MLRNLLEIRYNKSIKPNIRSIPSVSSMMMMPMLVNQIPASQKKTFFGEVDTAGFWDKIIIFAV